jgi:D-tyrosyl-tRNA(Tyr) deacylase
MISVIQRVTRAEVRVEGRVIASIDHGVLVLLGIETGDTDADAIAMARKIGALRFFAGRTPMDKTLSDVQGNCLVVSQFTLVGSLLGSNRPSFTRAESPTAAKLLYERVVAELRELRLSVGTGEFGAAMQVELVNDGPVTFVLRVREGRLVE